MSPDVHTLTGAYALDALDELERRRFEAHLAECPDCTREVDELRATAAKLAMAAAETPPDRLRQRVLAQVATTRQEPPATVAATAARPRPPRRTGWAVRLTAAAAGLAAAAALLLGVVTVRTGAERDAARAQLAELQSRYAPVAELASAPDARGDSGTGAHGGTAFVLASHARDRAVLLVADLPAPPAGHTYQAWLIGGAGQPRSAGLVPPDPGTGAPPLQFTGLAGATKVGLTVEPAGGSPQPTTTPVVLFDLPA
ncbi:MAG TPA: anti-sigma factor [Pseudonocardia sp.]|nr:anti-sigma factor [Pseudonocardia sp.]